MYVLEYLTSFSQILISKATHWRSIPWWWFTSWRDGTGLFDRLWSQHAFIGETDDFKWCLRSGCLWAVWLAGVLWLVSFQVPLCNRTLPLVAVLLSFSSAHRHQLTVPCTLIKSSVNVQNWYLENWWQGMVLYCGLVEVRTELSV